MQTRNPYLNPQNSVIPSGLPGYQMSRAMFKEWQGVDRKSRKDSFLDDVGEAIIVDNDNLYVVPAKALEYPSTQALLRNLGATRITKIVVAQDGGLLCTASGYVPETWLKTFADFSLPQTAEANKHFVKCFAPTYQGSLIGFHAIRTVDQRLNTKMFDQVNGFQISSVDMVGAEGKVNFALTTTPTFQAPKSTVFTREASIETLKAERSINAPWKMAPWAEGKYVQGLRGFLKDGKVAYTFLDTEKNALCMVTGDNKVKQLKDNVRGVLTPVTGPEVVRNHIATIVTKNEIVAIGQDDKVIADLNRPEHSELAQYFRDAGISSIQLGIHGRTACYLADGGSPMAHLSVAKTEGAYAAA